MNLNERVEEAFDSGFQKTLLESSKYQPLDAIQRQMMSQLFENTKKDLVSQINEGTFTQDIAQFTPIMLPMIRRVYPTLIANELLGVQAMSSPTGFMYALTNQYLGDGLKKVDDRTIPAGAIYRFSADDADKIKAAIADGSLVVGTTKIDDSLVLYVEDDKILVSVALDSQGANATKAVGATVDLGNATGLTIKAVYTNESSFYHILKNYTGPYTTSKAEQMGEDMNEIGFSISRKAVEVKSRKLKGKYSLEMYQDLKAQHGLLADEELMALMTYEIQAQQDREVVDFVKDNSTWLSDTAVFGTQTNMQVPEGRWEIERYRAQAIRIAKESSIIGLETKRGQGNTLLVSPMVATMLREVGSFQLAPVASDINIPVSGGVAGTFDNRFKVVVDQYAEDDFCTVLYKGDSNKDAMGFFMPYVPLAFTKVTDYQTGRPVLIATTRYALDTTPGVIDAKSNDRAKTYARSFGVNFANTVLAHNY